MGNIDTEFIERYQKLYEQDPKSKVFAPLAEAYRKIGMLKEALEVAEKGVKHHPDFPGGRVALGRIYMDSQDFKSAEKEFRKASELSPENILAHQLLAETYLNLRRTKDALKAYKMLLFLSPGNDRAQKAVKKLEALTADEYEDEIFTMKPIKEAVKEWENLFIESTPLEKESQTSAKEEKKLKFLDRILSVADAFIVRNDIDRALDDLQEAERLVGPHPEIVKRLKLIHKRQLDTIAHPQSSAELFTPKKRPSPLDEQIDFLQDLLQKIKERPI
ncbi:MAG: hypothetical protein A2Z20_07805 [Bdellovibrionales bacterium RBG_16_40_8]|nr:MAG: hypothetical protein A2Z20_07805 [Bdellovibrionales bacterium RBG_16_40_8]